MNPVGLRTSCLDPDWLTAAVGALRSEGFAVVTDVLEPGLVGSLRPALYGVREAIHREVGSGRLEASGERGVLRLMMRFDPLLFRLLELRPVTEIVNRVLSETAILHLQNGFILPSETQPTPSLFQFTFHRDFPRHLNGYCASVNCLMAVDEFRRENGATWVVPGSHQRPDPPDRARIDAEAVPVECPSGAMVVFDSTLWHAAGANTSGHDRLAINHQFTRSWIKQQIDYVRALGPDAVLSQSPRVQQLLGWYTRVVTSLDEYYQPEERRLYRKGQG